LKETNSRDRQLVAKKEQNVKHCQDTISVTDPPTANNGWHTTNHPSSLFFAVRDKQDLDQEHP